MDFFSKLFSSDFMPHGHCYYWRPAILWLHVISDSVIALAYYTIPVALIYLVRKRRDLVFHWMFVMFGVFIFACGTTHVMNIWEVWHGTYRLGGMVKVVTAVASIVTAVVLWPLVPKALALPSAAQLAAANADLAAAYGELESFSYTVSHDLRAPLRGIDGYSSLLLEDHGEKLPPDARRYLDLVRESAQQMGKLVDDLLDFARLSRHPVAKDSVRTSELVRGVVEELRDAQGDRHARVTLGPLPDCRADEALLRQVYRNLISNALKFTRKAERPVVEIGSRAENGARTTYYVKDNGVGFDMKYTGKLFGVFQRLHRSEDYEGTGVGLAIVERIVRRHGGRVWAEAAPGRGATFFFTLGGGPDA
ncbi:MAG TPA: ATP-binding protein [Candidatus Eisenbacteria bacterium]|jgi:signal transduction histidine kinase